MALNLMLCIDWDLVILVNLDSGMKRPLAQSLRSLVESLGAGLMASILIYFN